MRRRVGQQGSRGHRSDATSRVAARGSRRAVAAGRDRRSGHRAAPAPRWSDRAPPARALARAAVAAAASSGKLVRRPGAIERRERRLRIRLAQAKLREIGAGRGLGGAAPGPPEQILRAARRPARSGRARPVLAASRRLRRSPSAPSGTSCGRSGTTRRRVSVPARSPSSAQTVATKASRIVRRSARLRRPREMDQHVLPGAEALVGSPVRRYRPRKTVQHREARRDAPPAGRAGASRASASSSTELARRRAGSARVRSWPRRRVSSSLALLEPAAQIRSASRLRHAAPAPGHRRSDPGAFVGGRSSAASRPSTSRARSSLPISIAIRAAGRPRRSWSE